MKKSLLVLALMIASANAEASKARMAALGFTDKASTTDAMTYPVIVVEDTQSIFNNPAHMHLIPINAANDLNFTRSKLDPTAEQLKSTQQQILAHL